MKKTIIYFLILPFLSFSQAKTDENKTQGKDSVAAADKAKFSETDSILMRSSKALKDVGVDEKPKSDYNLIWNSNYKQHRYSSFDNILKFIYHYGKLKINASVEYEREKNFWENDANRFFPDASFIGESTTDFDFNSLITFIDIEYQIFKNTTINISSYNDEYENIFETQNTIDILSTSSSNLNRNYVGNRLLNSSLQRNSFNFLLRHDFSESDKYFTFEADWIQRLGYYYQNTYGQDFDTQGMQVQDRLYDVFHEGNFDIDVYGMNSEFYIPLEWVDLTIGARWVYIELDYDINFFRRFNLNYEQNIALSPVNKYIENRQSLYMNFNKKLKKWEVDLGVRLENTVIDGYVSRADTDELDDHYLTPLPFINAIYNIDKKNRLRLSYLKSFKRPPFRFINPSIGIYHAYENYNGNPFLTPSIRNDYKISYDHDSRYSVTLSYINIKDGFNALAQFTPDNVVTHQLLNYVDSDLFQISGTRNLEMGRFLNTSIQLDGFYTNNQFQVNTINTLDVLGWYGRINNKISINKSITSSLNFWYRSKNIEQEFSYDSQYSLDFEINFLSRNQNFSVELRVIDLLRSMTQYKEATVNTINQQFRNYWAPARTVEISATYTFGNKKLAYVERVSGNVTDQTR